MSKNDAGTTAVRLTPGGLTLAAIQQLRPKQWAKNVLVLAALVFSESFRELGAVQDALIAFAAFSLVSSAGYVFNDYLDREADRRHPKKRLRPIASGALPEWAALLLLAAALASGIGLGWSLSPLFLAVLVLYLATTLSYSLYFKHRVILDVMFLASGFVWRAIAGAVAIDVAVSPWLFLCTAFLALFIGLNKRRAELMSVGAGGGTRKNLADYSPQMLDQFEAIVTGNTVLSYCLYTVLGPTPWMTLTIPFVLYAIFRYIYLVHQRGEGGAPEDTLLGDRPIMLTIALYALTVFVVLNLPLLGIE